MKRNTWDYWTMKLQLARESPRRSSTFTTIPGPATPATRNDVVYFRDSKKKNREGRR